MNYQFTVYVAGPYSNGDIIENVNRSIVATNQLLDLGVAPYCPHLSFYLDKLQARTYDEWLELCFKWVAVCDGFYRLSGYSPGADKEEALAFELGKPIFRTLKEVQKWLSN